MRKKIVVLAFIVLFLVMSGCSGGKNPEEIIALVNDEAIYQKEWDDRIRIMKINYEMMTGQPFQENEDRELMEDIKEMAFEDLILQKLLRQESERHGFVIDLDQIEENLNYIRDLNNSEREGGFEQFTADLGIDEDYIAEELKTQQIYTLLKTRVTGEIEVNEEEVRRYYDGNSSRYIKPGGINIAHILLETEQEANEIMEEIAAGADFSAMAREHSMCPSKGDGGNLGIVHEGSGLVEAFKRAALQLEPGELTPQPVKTEFGFHIIKAGERVEESIIPFTEVKGEILYQLEDQAREEAFFSFLQELREKADIVDKR